MKNVCLKFDGLGINSSFQAGVKIYDGMTSPTMAEKYLDELEAPKKSFVLFEKTAHYPQFEELDKFYSFMEKNFK